MGHPALDLGLLYNIIHICTIFDLHVVCVPLIKLEKQPEAETSARRAQRRLQRVA